MRITIMPKRCEDLNDFSLTCDLYVYLNIVSVSYTNDSTYFQMYTSLVHLRPRFLR